MKNSYKKFDLSGIGEIRVVKRRNNRNIRLSFTGNGVVRISIPCYLPYKAGLDFAKSRKDWIDRNRPTRQKPLADGQIFLNKYSLVMRASDTPRARYRITNNTINVFYPRATLASSTEVQAAAERGVKKAIMTEATKQLPSRLEELAQHHGFKYSSVKIKSLKRRWGSCDQNKNIVLNCYLIQLESELIDYVLLHELTHTIHRHHQPGFWGEMESHLPNAKKLAHQARAQQPGIAID